MKDSTSLASFAARVRRGFALASAGETAVPVTAARGALNFNQLALELFALQFQHCAAYRRLCGARGVTTESLKHWTQIPPVPTAAFKELELTSLSRQERSGVFFSSGTSGQQPSRHFHSAESLALYEAALLPWFQRHLLPELLVCPGAKSAPPAKTPQIVSLTPTRRDAPNSSLVHMFDTVAGEFGPGRSLFYGAVAQDGSWELKTDLVVDALGDLSAAGQAVLLLGTAFLFVHLLDALSARGLRLRLPPSSRALETGGYKGRSRALPKGELHSLISERLGLSPACIVCEYGMSELSSQAYDRVAGGPMDAADAVPSRVFRFAPWARTQVCSPEDGKEVADGQTGLLRIFDLANVYSVMAIQTEDLAVRRGDGFELLGRAELAEARGCSLMAS